MKIPELDLNIVVASRERAERLTNAEPVVWCVISIHGKTEIAAQLPKARELETLVFDDVIQDEPARGLLAPRAAHARIILEAARRFRGQPLLIHCARGISRSAAVALGVLYWHARLNQIPDAVEQTFKWLQALGEFSPNARLARLLVEAIEPDQPEPFLQFCDHPQWHLKRSEDFYSRFFPKPKRG